MHLTNIDLAFAIDWIKAMVQMMKITVDYTEDAPHDHLIKNGILQMFLSISNYLGWKGNFQPRQPWGKLAMLALNLRNIVIMITLSNNTITVKQSTTTPLDEPGKTSSPLSSKLVSYILSITTQMLLTLWPAASSGQLTCSVGSLTHCSVSLTMPNLWPS